MNVLSPLSDTDSLSQGSSVGSLGLEDDDDRNSLKNHFDTLASSLSEGMHNMIVMESNSGEVWVCSISFNSL